MTEKIFDMEKAVAQALADYPVETRYVFFVDARDWPYKILGHPDLLAELRANPDIDLDLPPKEVFVETAVGPVVDYPDYKVLILGSDADNFVYSPDTATEQEAAFYHELGHVVVPQAFHHPIYFPSDVPPVMQRKAETLADCFAAACMRARTGTPAAAATAVVTRTADSFDSLLSTRWHEHIAIYMTSPALALVANDNQTDFAALTPQQRIATAALYAEQAFVSDRRIEELTHALRPLRDAWKKFAEDKAALIEGVEAAITAAPADALIAQVGPVFLQNLKR